MSRLSLFLLGSPRFELNGEPIRVKNRRAMALLAYLAATPQSHSRDSLINLLWPDSDSSRGRTLLRTALYALNKAFKSDWLDADRDNIALNPDSDLWIDVDSFHNLLAQCRSHGHPPSEICPDCLDPLTDAVDLYGGDFLTGFSLKDSVNFYDWQVSQTQSLHSDLTGALERLAPYLIEQKEFEKAISHAQRWLELDRINEEAHRHLMEAYARSGRRPAALEQYEECVKILKEKLGISPQESTIQLYEAIKDNSLDMTETSSHKTSAGVSRSTPPNNLPALLTSFIGRENEVEALTKLLSDGMRLVTLTGPGGTGKTRLGLKVAGDLIDHLDDGVFFVSLAPISDPDLVPSTIAHTLGVQEIEGQSILESLKNYLGDKERLLVLDNFEQVVSAAPTVSDLLTSCPGLKILATSREVLHLQGEHEFPVSPLTLPDLEDLPEAESLSQYEAVELFIQRAVALKADFSITNENTPAVAEICHRLDGLPLAIELAASRIKMLTSEAILERLSSRMKLLTGGARDLPERQQTMQSAIAWSHDLLEESEKVLFSQLSVFVGGFTLKGAEAVCNVDGDVEIDILEGVSSLVDKSLLKQEASQIRDVDEPRFLMLETIREYGLESLREGEEEEETRRNHANFFLALVEEAEPKFQGSDQVVWLDRLEVEHDNIRAVLEWSLGDGKNVGARHALPQRLVGVLWWFWYIRGYLSEGQEWSEKAVSADSGASDSQKKSARTMSARAKALIGAGVLMFQQEGNYEVESLAEEVLAIYRELEDKGGIAWSFYFMGSVAGEQGDLEQAKTLLEDGLTLFREIGDKWGIARSLYQLAKGARGMGEHERMNEFHEESLALFRELGDKWGTSFLLADLGMVALVQENYAQAKTLFEESLILSRELGNKGGIAGSLLSLGIVALWQEDYSQAKTLFEESLTLSREIGNKMGIPGSLGSLGIVALSQGDYGQARALFDETLTLNRELGSKGGIADSLLLLGMVALSQGDYDQATALFEESLTLFRDLGIIVEISLRLAALAGVSAARGGSKRAAQLFGAREALSETFPGKIPPLLPVFRVEYERYVNLARAGLGEEAFAAAWAEGRKMSMEQAIDYALNNEDD